MGRRNLIGATFGRWSVIDKAEDHISPSGKKEPAWLCECSCDNHTRKVVLQRSLIYGLSQSCGCLVKERLHNNLNDLTGKKFGRLTVLQRADDLITENGNRFTRWDCRCDCGNYTTVLASALTRNDRPSRSCGCLQKDKVSEIKDNVYDFSNDDYVIGYIDNTNDKFLFDKEDYDKVKQYHWYKESTGYIRASNKERIFLHRLIMGNPDNMVIDHKNHNLLDNRKSNLRIVTNSQNGMNKVIISNNTSGVTGVVWVKNRQQWRAEIKINMKTIYLGLFDNINDAIAARKAAEEKYFGEYSYDNSMKEVS